MHADARFVGCVCVYVVGGPPWRRCCRLDSPCTFSPVTQKDSCTVWIELKLFLGVLQKIPHEVGVLFAPLLSACVLTNSLVSCFSSDDIIGVPATCLSCWRKSFPMTPIVPFRCYLTRLLYKNPVGTFLPLSDTKLAKTFEKGLDRWCAIFISDVMNHSAE